VNKGKNEGQGRSTPADRHSRYEGALLGYFSLRGKRRRGGGVRIFLESRDPPITHAEHVGEVTLPFPARGLDVPCIVPKRNDPIILGYEFS
jgi:hypothetical protein